jgi:hypothetical protein
MEASYRLNAQRALVQDGCPTILLVPASDGATASLAAREAGNADAGLAGSPPSSPANPLVNMASIVAMVETLVAIPSRFIAASFA